MSNLLINVINKISNWNQRVSNENKAKITDELNGSQGNKVDVGGYYIFDDAKVSAVMRPSSIYNESLKK